MNDSFKDIGEMVEKIANSVPLVMGVYVDTSIQKESPSSGGLPMHYKYSPKVTVNTSKSGVFELNTGEEYESPDQELVRAQARCKALELGLEVAKRLNKYEGAAGATGDNDVKVNDLPLDVAVQQLDVYRTELQRIEADHEGKAWM